MVAPLLGFAAKAVGGALATKAAKKVGSLLFKSGGKVMAGKSSMLGRVASVGKKLATGGAIGATLGYLSSKTLGASKSSGYGVPVRRAHRFSISRYAKKILKAKLDAKIQKYKLAPLKGL